MLLRNNDRFLEVLDVANQNSHRRFLAQPGDVISTNGFFFDYADATFGLGVSHGKILVLLANLLVPYGPGFKTEIKETRELRVFTVTQEGVKIISVNYLPRKPSGLPFETEDEDADGFLWIHNVLSSDERRAILIENNDKRT